MRSLLARFIGDEAGATAIEYAIIAGGLSIVIVAAVNGIGINLSGRFDAMSTALK
ncbi:Flp family type IVb pilin [Bradyrhizobium erythrophlei]|uniref:Flp family type IVb pilin n=1 Tax=Bradyrhizobium erythrophlei TaxID=1437360 RepID=UPI0035EF74EC